MKIQEPPKVPERDAIVKARGESFEGMIGPRQFDVGDADAIAAKFIAKEMFETKVDDVVASRRNHEKRRHTGVDHVSWRSASVTRGLLFRRATAEVEQDVTQVDNSG